MARALGLIVASVIALPAALAAQPGPIADVRTRAWIDHEVVRPGELVRIWISIENRGTGSVRGVTFTDFQTPGFIRNGCWIGHTPSCVNGNSVVSGLPTLAAGSTLAASALLIRDNSSLPDGAKVVLTGTLQWQVTPPPSGRRVTGQPAFTMDGVVATGPVDLLATRWYATPQAMGIRELAKDLVLPLLLLVGGYLFQRFQHARTERQAIFTEMLGKVTRDTERHFLPVASALSDVLQRCQAIHEAADMNAAWHDERERLVFAVLMLNRQITRLADEVGGFYLRMRSADPASSPRNSERGTCGIWM